MNGQVNQGQEEPRWRILCVDDEQRILDGLQRVLHDRFEVVVASSGKQALQVIDEQPEPFAAIVSDMRMPEMNGAAFLQCAQQVSPDSTRILLTGYAEVEAAIAAVNEGQIFRFLSKPCPVDSLVATLQEGCEFHRLKRIERDLLEQTLHGAVTALTEVLAFVAPGAFHRANHLRDIASHLANRLGLSDSWQLEIAALLSLIGCVTLSDVVLERALAGQNLLSEDQRCYEEHPEVAWRLLSEVPRLEGVATIIRWQNEGQDLPDDLSPELRQCVELLRLAKAADKLFVSGENAQRVSELLAGGPWGTVAAACLADYRPASQDYGVRVLSLTELRSFMVLDEPAVLLDGKLIAPAGTELRALVIERLKAFDRGVGVKQPLRVRVPGASSGKANGGLKLAQQELVA